MRNYYVNKRHRYGLTRSDVAKALDISYEKYTQIERGEVKMPKKLINKFNEIMNKGKNIHTLEKLNNETKINQYYDYLVAGGFKEKMKEYNIPTKTELGKLLGYKDGTTLSKYKTSKEAPYDYKNKLYIFFNDELNIQPNKKIEEQDETDYMLISLMKTYMEDENINEYDFADRSGVSQPTIYRIVRGDQCPREKTRKKLLSFLENENNKKTESINLFTEPSLFDTKTLANSFPNVPKEKNELIPDETDSKDVYVVKKLYDETISKRLDLTEELNKLQKRADILLDILHEIERF